MRRKANDAMWIAVCDEYVNLPQELRDDLHLDIDAIRARTISEQQQARVKRFVVAYLLSRGKSAFQVHLRLGMNKREIQNIERTILRDPTATTNRQKQVTLMLFRIKEREDALRRHRTKLEAKGEKILLTDRKLIVEIIKTEDQLETTRRKLLGLDAPVQHEIKEKRVATIRLVVHGSREQLQPMLESPNTIDIPSLPVEVANEQDDYFPELD